MSICGSGSLFYVQTRDRIFRSISLDPIPSTTGGLFGTSATSTIPIISLPPRHLSSCSLPSVCALPILLAALAMPSRYNVLEHQLNIWLSALKYLPSWPNPTPGARGDHPGLSNPTSPHGRTHAHYDWKCIRPGATVDKAAVNKSSSSLVSLFEG